MTDGDVDFVRMLLFGDDPIDIATRVPEPALGERSSFRSDVGVSWMI